MKENFRYQIKINIEALLATWMLGVGWTFMLLISNDFFSDVNLGTHFYHFASGCMAGVSLVTHSIVDAYFLQLSITFGNSRKQWFAVSVIYKIIYSIILSLSILFLAFLVSQIIKEQSLTIQGKDVLFSFIIILLFLFIGDIAGAFISRFGAIKFCFILGGVLGVVVGVGYTTRDKIGRLYEDILSRPVLTGLVATVIFIPLIFIFWRLIRKQEVKI